MSGWVSHPLPSPGGEADDGLMLLLLLGSAEPLADVAVVLLLSLSASSEGRLVGVVASSSRLASPSIRRLPTSGVLARSVSLDWEEGGFESSAFERMEIF